MDISTIINIILTIVTAIMAIATCFMAYSTKESVNELKESRKESNKPHIVFYFTLKEHSVNFVVKNLGKTTASNVKIGSDPPLVDSDSFKASVFDNIIPSFPPGFEINMFFEQSFTIIQEFDNLKYNIIITYEDIYGEINKELYILDFTILENMFLKSHADVDVSLKNINKNLVDINNTLKGLKSN